MPTPPRARWLLMVLLASPLQACNCSTLPGEDAGVDAGAPDAGPPDAGVDAGAPDAGPPDAGEDAGAPDAGPPDAGVDAGQPVDATGCASGQRAGLLDAGAYPDVAACAGAWEGDVADAGALCAAGWHVCTGAEEGGGLQTVVFEEAQAVTGCFAFNAAQDNYHCYPGCSAAVESGVDSAANIDMGGLGGGCAFRFPGPAGNSCLGTGRIDASENTGTGCGFTAGLTGVVCCRR